MNVGDINGDINVKYEGCHFSKSTQIYLSAILEKIFEESPYGSVLRATFSRKGKELKGTIQINSSAGPFFAVASGTGLKIVSKKLVEQMRRHLNKWKSERFDHHSLKDLPVIEVMNPGSYYELEQTSLT